MRLLVSVRSADEARAVLEGGADVVDAKEPARGSLGPVEPVVLEEIAGAVPAQIPLSAALGDFVAPSEAATAVAAVPSLGRTVPLLLKLGFAGVADRARVETILSAAVRAARGRTEPAAVVAVAYADHHAAGTPAAMAVLESAATAGAAGVLVDTWGKDGRDLLDWLPRSELDEWVSRGRTLGLLTAIAGSLRGERLALAAGCGADVLGVRGAVCQKGRGGMAVATLVSGVRGRLPPAATVLTS